MLLVSKWYQVQRIVKGLVVGYNKTLLSRFEQVRFPRVVEKIGQEENRPSNPRKLNRETLRFPLLRIRWTSRLPRCANEMTPCEMHRSLGVPNISSQL